MSIKYRLLRAVIAWLMRVDPYILREMVIGEGKHIHRNPVRKALRNKYPVTEQ
jgi:hypothetical protein